MSSLVALDLEKDVLQLRDMASNLERALSTERSEERALWDEIHGRLGGLAGYLSIADSSMATEDLIIKLRGKVGPESSLHPDVAVLIPEVRVILKKRIGADNADSSKAISLLKHLLVVVAKELDMFPLCDSIHTTMIQDSSVQKNKKEYTFYEEEVNHMIRCYDELSAPNAPYTVVSIVGAQSSGKSYLLNQLFGTDFPVMNARHGRKQTTKGILISRCIMPSLLVLDVEGFDGRERGQDTSFEKQAALFALTTSDLMLVNISMYDIGREQGGGATLFKTIFQERTKLPPCLTKIIAVIRNYDGETPVHLLEHDIVENLEKMWRDVHVGCSEPVIFNDYIEVKVVALPEKKEPDFREKVKTLRKLLSESNLDRNRSARVPASSFAVSSRMLWDQIRHNERLDLPAHKLMVATVCCQRIVEEAIQYFASDKDCKHLIAQESPRDFKEASDKLLESIVARYDIATDMYDAGIRAKEREKLVQGVEKRLRRYSRELIHKMRDKMSEQFKNEFAMILRSMEVSGADLQYPTEMLKSYRKRFDNFCKDLTLLNVRDSLEICGDFQEELTSHASYQISGVKEERVGKEFESAKHKSDKDAEELRAKLNAMKLQAEREKEEMRRVKEKQENKQKLAREEAEREHQKFLKEEKAKNEILKQDVERLKRLNRELEAKQKSATGGCSIL